MIKKIIKIYESLDKYYYKLFWSLNLADKKAQKDELSSNDKDILIYIKSILGPYF